MIAQIASLNIFGITLFSLFGFTGITLLIIAAILGSFGMPVKWHRVFAGTGLLFLLAHAFIAIFA